MKSFTSWIRSISSSQIIFESKQVLGLLLKEKLLISREKNAPLHWNYYSIWPSKNTAILAKNMPYAYMDLLDLIGHRFSSLWLLLSLQMFGLLIKRITCSISISLQTVVEIQMRIQSISTIFFIFLFCLTLTRRVVADRTPKKLRK